MEQKIEHWKSRLEEIREEMQEDRDSVTEEFTTGDQWSWLFGAEMGVENAIDELSQIIGEDQQNG